MKKIFSILKRKYAAYLNEQAFTLIEMLFSLFVLMTIIFFLSPIFHLIQNSFHPHEKIQAMEWSVFCSQIKKEIRMSTKIQVVESTLVLTEDVGTVIYEPYENSLRRRVNYSGHEILLQSISKVSFTLLNNSLKVCITDLEGKDYQVIVYSFLDWNGSL